MGGLKLQLGPMQNVDGETTAIISSSADMCSMGEEVVKGPRHLSEKTGPIGELKGSPS